MDNDSWASEQLFVHHPLQQLARQDCLQRGEIWIPKHTDPGFYSDNDFVPCSHSVCLVLMTGVTATVAPLSYYVHRYGLRTGGRQTVSFQTILGLCVFISIFWRIHISCKTYWGIKKFYPKSINCAICPTVVYLRFLVLCVWRKIVII